MFGCSRRHRFFFLEFIEFIDVAALIVTFGGFFVEEVDDAIDSQLHVDILHFKAHFSEVFTSCQQIEMV